MIDQVYYSETEHVTVEDRGAGFGKIYVYRDDDSVEAIMLWTKRGVMAKGAIEPTRDQKDRAVRALAETKAGAKTLGVEPREEKPRVLRIEEAVQLVLDTWVADQVLTARGDLRQYWPRLAQALDTLQQETSR